MLSSAQGTKRVWDSAFDITETGQFPEPTPRMHWRRGIGTGDMLSRLVRWC